MPGTDLVTGLIKERVAELRRSIARHQDQLEEFENDVAECGEYLAASFAQLVELESELEKRA